MGRRMHSSTVWLVPGTFTKDLRDPLLHSERTQGFAADPDYWEGEVFAYVGLPQNLKDLKDPGQATFVAAVLCSLKLQYTPLLACGCTPFNRNPRC